MLVVLPSTHQLAPSPLSVTTTEWNHYSMMVGPFPSPPRFRPLVRLPRGRPRGTQEAPVDFSRKRSGLEKRSDKTTLYPGEVSFTFYTSSYFQHASRSGERNRRVARTPPLHTSPQEDNDTALLAPLALVSASVDGWNQHRRLEPARLCMTQRQTSCTFVNTCVGFGLSRMHHTSDETVVEARRVAPPAEAALDLLHTPVRDAAPPAAK